MSSRPDYIRTLEIFLKYQKVHGKHLMRLSDFLREFDAIFIGSPNAYDILDEMESLDLIKEDNDCDHIFGDDGMLLLEKGYELLKAHRNMQVGNDGIIGLEELKIKIGSCPDRGHKGAYIFTLTELGKTYASECFTATISLCGKLLEIYFYELLQNSHLSEELYLNAKGDVRELRNDLTLGRLKSIAQRLPSASARTIPNEKVIQVIIQYRNTSVHYSKDNYNPTKEIAEGVIKFLIDCLNKYFS